MDTTDSALLFYGVAVVITLVIAAGVIVLLAIAWEIASDYFTRDRTQPYWRGPQSPLSGGRRR